MGKLPSLLEDFFDLQQSIESIHPEQITTTLIFNKNFILFFYKFNEIMKEISNLASWRCKKLESFRFGGISSMSSQSNQSRLKLMYAIIRYF